MIFFTFIFIAIAIFEIRSFSNRPDSYVRAVRFFYSYIICFGVVFLFFMIQLIDYKFYVYDLDTLSIAILSGYISLLCGAFATQLFFGRTVQSSSSNDDILLTVERKLLGLFVVSVAAILVYLAANGLSFGRGSYEQRYEDARGLGILLIFFPGFMPYICFLLINTKKKLNFFYISLVGLIISFATFYILNGYRQIFIGTIIVIFITMMKKDMIRPFFWILIGTILLPMFAVVMSFLRYAGESSKPFGSLVQEALTYIQGDLFPVDAPLRTMWHCSLRECPGIDVFLNHLMRIIPRVVWPDKPEIMLDSAGYYTQVILDYPRAVTLSSTIVSEGLMIYGSLGVVAICFISGIFSRALDYVMTSFHKSTLYYIFYSQIYMEFFWVREGFQNGLYRVIIMFILFLSAVFVSYLIPAGFRKFRPLDHTRQSS